MCIFSGIFESFEYPKKPCRLSASGPVPTETGNRFTSLPIDVQPGTSSAPHAQKKKHMPTIFIKLARIEGPMLAQLKTAAPTCYFEYVATGLLSPY